MGEIELVIKIDEKLYKAIKKNGYIYDEEVEDVALSIIGGTTLPKGHGRIADMDEAIKCIEEVNGEDAIWAIGLINWACGKRTVLEADEEKN